MNVSSAAAPPIEFEGLVKRFGRASGMRLGKVGVVVGSY